MRHDAVQADGGDEDADHAKHGRELRHQPVAAQRALDLLVCLGVVYGCSPKLSRSKSRAALRASTRRAYAEETRRCVAPAASCRRSWKPGSNVQAAAYLKSSVLQPELTGPGVD